MLKITIIILILGITVTGNVTKNEGKIFLLCLLCQNFLCFIVFIYVLYIYNLKLTKISCFVKNRKSINHNSGRLCNAGLNYAKMKK